MKFSLVKNNSPQELVATAANAIPPSGIREFFDLVYSMPDCISLGVGEPDFTTPWRVSDSGIFAIKDGNTHYTPNRGLPELCSLIAQYLTEKFNLNYDPKSELLITMGVSQGLDLALRSIINPGDEIIIIEPCYVSYPANISVLHGKPVVVSALPENNFKVTGSDIERAITDKTKAILLNYPANPTGASFNKKTLEEIADIAIKNNILVLSDEIYSALTYDTEHYSIARIPEMNERTIYLNGFSKSHAMTGWRLGFVAAPEYLLKVILKIHQYTALCAPSISQFAAIEALKNGDMDVEKMKGEYLKRRNFMVNRLNEIGLSCHLPEGAFYVFPSIASSGLTGRDFALQLLKKEKVAVIPGNVFGEIGTDHIRCSYATSMENLKEAMDRIERFVKNLS